MGVKLEELKKILGEMMNEYHVRSNQVITDRVRYMPDEWYEPLEKLGLLADETEILSDKHYDVEAVHFARMVLNLIGDKTKGDV